MISSRTSRPGWALRSASTIMLLCVRAKVLPRLPTMRVFFSSVFGLGIGLGFGFGASDFAAEGFAFDGFGVTAFAASGFGAEGFAPDVLAAGCFDFGAAVFASG